MEQLGSHGTIFREISYWKFILKLVRQIQVWLNLDTKITDALHVSLLTTTMVSRCLRGKYTEFN